MEKKIKIILTTVVVAIVVIGVVLFFVIFKDEKSKFIGTWTVVENPAGGITGGTFTFQNNGAFSVGDGSYGTYKVEDSKLCLTDPFGGINGPQTACFNYEFSNGNSHLTLKYEGQIVMILNKS